MPFAFVGRAQIGPAARIMPFAFVDDNVRVGEGSVVGPGCVLMVGTTLGARVVLNPGVILGGDGFGFAPHGVANVKVPQIGGVCVGDDVEMGANTCVDRGAVSDTRIGNGTKIDNLVQLGHGVRVGEHAVIVAQVGVAGSTQIGDRAVLAGQVGIVGHVRIGDDVRIGAKSGVHRSIPDQAAYSGTPAIPHADFLKRNAHFNRLGRYVDRLKAQEAKSELLQEEVRTLRALCVELKAELQHQSS